MTIHCKRICQFFYLLLCSPWRAVAASALLAISLIGVISSVYAATESKISSTKHNLSVSGPGTVKATSETQICVFCHTPHSANTTVTAPLWNRAVNTTANAYTRYTSLSLDANNITNGFSAQPGGSSLLCLSCHDGTIALGEVGVLPKKTGTTGASIVLNGTNGGKMPVGLGANTGFTRLIGTNLTNDHPISITYDEDLAVADKELAHMDASQKNDSTTYTAGALIGIRSSGYKPLLPLERTGPLDGNGLKMGQVQCATCHDPHLFDAADLNRKFLRLNRLQTNAPPQNDTFNKDNEIICMGCHRKSYSSWGMSAHAKDTVANKIYTDAAADLRQFPRGTQVWQASCLNCHDSHTVQGSRRLLREGVVGLATMGTGTGSSYQPGYAPLAETITPSDADPGNSKTSGIESTCFQCHRALDSSNILKAPIDGTMVPAVKSLFDLPYGMPIVTADQANGTREVHNVKSGDMKEDPVNLGQGGFAANANRHAECTDCHNPHRVRRSRAFWSTLDADKLNRTHVPGGPDGNMASGVLRGTWGVEPTFNWSATSWPSFPTFTENIVSVSGNVKQGDPGPVSAPVGRETAGTGSVAVTYVTREYQLCFKCHSNYTNGDTPGSFPALVANYAPLVTTRRTPTSAANGLTRYTNVAAEFGSVKATNPATSGTDQGEFANGASNIGTACVTSLVGPPYVTTDCAPRVYEARVGSAAASGTGKSGTDIQYNHRSWHPVVFPTGRDRAERAMNAAGRINLLPPYKASIGLNTMHCADCHGQAASWIPGQDSVVESGGADPNQVQGPHGSENPFLLRGIWTDAVNLSNIRSSSSQFTTNRPLCGNCHQPNGSGVPNDGSGFRNNHVAAGSSGMGSIRCMGCHIAVPHGWRNKAFLVNLRCVGTEVGRGSSSWSAGVKATPTDCDDFGNYSTKLLEEPYYYQAVLRVVTWARSGTWGQSNCGGGSMTGGSCN